MCIELLPLHLWKTQGERRFKNSPLLPLFPVLQHQITNNAEKQKFPDRDQGILANTYIDTIRGKI